MKNSILLGVVFCLSVVSVLVFNGCTGTNSSSHIRIQFPQVSQKLVGEVGALSTNSPWSGHLSAATNINCYALMVGGPEPDMSHSYCDSIVGPRLMTFGQYVGGVPAGDSVSIEVPPGIERDIYLVAMQANAGYCHDFHGSGPSQGQITHPRLIEKISTSLDPGEEKTLTIPIPSDLTALQEVDQCQVNDFPSGGGTSPQQLFGTGRDGSLTSTGSETINFSSDSYGSLTNVSHGTAAGAPVPSSKEFSSSRFITAVGSTGRTLTLDSSFTTDEFDVEDEVIWSVVSRIPPLSADTCGGGLNIGSWGTGVITGVSGTTIDLDRSVSNNPGSLNNTNISAALNTTHCRIQVSRVPHFENFDVQSGPVTITTNPLNTGDRTYGVIAFRAKHLILNGNLTISANGLGYHGVSNGTGSSPLGDGSPYLGTTLGAYESGGGTDGSEGGGGGGHFKAGGNSNTSTTDGGVPMTLCSGSPCLPVRDQIVFFGGAGGAASTAAGANGGGVIVIHAERISGSGTLTLQASGVDGISGTGGGAGGTIHLTVADLDAGLALDAKGGGNGGGNGGVGSGGGVEISFCDSQSNTDPSVNINIGTSPNEGVQEVRDEPSLCL